MLASGYDVFRAVSPACSCDLIILAEGLVLRVEVTTGQVYRNGNVYHCKKHAGEKFDVLAVVSASGISYEGLPTLKTA